jgi:aristolochene synthase
MLFSLLSALMRFSMDLPLEPTDSVLLRAIEQNHAKHITVVNDIYSWEKESRQAEKCAKEGSALCSAVKIMANNAGLDIESSKRVLWTMVREWEAKHEALCNALCDPVDLLSTQAMYVEGLKYQMSGNEAWSKITPRYLVLE